MPKLSQVVMKALLNAKGAINRFKHVYFKVIFCKPKPKSSQNVKPSGIHLASNTKLNYKCRTAL